MKEKGRANPGNEIKLGLEYGTPKRRRLGPG